MTFDFAHATMVSFRSWGRFRQMALRTASPRKTYSSLSSRRDEHTASRARNASSEISFCIEYLRYLKRVRGLLGLGLGPVSPASVVSSDSISSSSSDCNAARKSDQHPILHAFRLRMRRFGSVANHCWAIVAGISMNDKSSRLRFWCFSWREFDWINLKLRSTPYSLKVCSFGVLERKEMSTWVAKIERNCNFGSS
uniref:(northern house mosquito) hypothetical protein n=1 Tax=Culex pipiens TaxID=7175 RepID=A0A8D8FVK1_CULPI